MTRHLVTIVTATTGRDTILRAVESVARQSYKNIQHLIVFDNPKISPEILGRSAMAVDVIRLPYSTGEDRFNGHRIYGASTFLGKGDFFCFLDDDNWFEPNHIESLIKVIDRGFNFAFSFRNVVGIDGNFICRDECESLGKWPSVLANDDFFIDVNCYFLPRQLALFSAPIWYRRFRELGVEDVDRALLRFFRENKFSYETSGEYSVNYTAGNTQGSVRPEFFIAGNQKMLEKNSGQNPWAGIISNRARTAG